MPIAPNRKRGLLWAIIAVVVLLALVSGGFFAYQFYLMNKKDPETVYERGLYSTGVGFQKLTESEVLEKITRSEMKGKLSFSATDSGRSWTDYSGVELGDGCSVWRGESELTMDAVMESDDASMNLEYVEQGEKMLSLEARTVSETGSVLPNLYFRFDPKDPCGANLNKLMDIFVEAGETGELPDDIDFHSTSSTTWTWYKVDTDAFYEAAGVDAETILEDFNLGKNSDPALEVTAEDWAALADALTKTLSERLFTSDEETAILSKDKVLAENVQFKEEERKTHKYLVSLNADNIVKYAEASFVVFEESAVYKKLINDDEKRKSYREAKQEILDDLKDPQFKEDVADLGLILWIDVDRKLIRNMRFFPADDLPAGDEEPTDKNKLPYQDIGFLVGEDSDFTLSAEVVMPCGMDYVYNDAEYGTDYCARDAEESMGLEISVNLKEETATYSVYARMEDFILEAELEVATKASGEKIEAPADYKEIKFEDSPILEP